MIFLQLINDENLLQEYELADIGKLFSQSSDVFKTDIKLNIENYFFINNIEDDEEKAALHLIETKKRIADILKSTEH